MKVSLVNYTGIGHPNKRFAADMLVFTKQTRLQMSPGLLDEIHSWSDEKIQEELLYMSNTIPSSWEFIDYTFMIEQCDRGFTHQLVRTRQASYAQQTMRVLDVSDFGYNTGPTIESSFEAQAVYDECMSNINEVYQGLINDGVAIEDARGVLPTNIQTNIVAKFNLRTLAELISKRSSPRVQGAYRDFIQQMADAILEVHPWAHVFLRNRKVEAAAKLDAFIQATYDYQDSTPTSQAEVNELIKLVDILRG